MTFLNRVRQNLYFHSSFTLLSTIAITITILHDVALAVCRVYFSPLTEFLAPKLTALT